MCDVHGVFALRSLLRRAFLILLGTYLTVCAQAQQAPGRAICPRCNNLYFETR